MKIFRIIIIDFLAIRFEPDIDFVKNFATFVIFNNFCIVCIRKFIKNIAYLG